MDNTGQRSGWGSHWHLLRIKGHTTRPKKNNLFLDLNRTFIHYILFVKEKKMLSKINLINSSHVSLVPHYRTIWSRILPGRITRRIPTTATRIERQRRRMAMAPGMEESAVGAQEVNRPHCPCRIHQARRSTMREAGMDGTRTDRVDRMESPGEIYIFWLMYKNF